MNRHELVSRLARSGTYDLAIVGGGATGLGVALDAAARGFQVVLLESHDFAKGTSSRATKLVHGGVRYLAAMLGRFKNDLRLGLAAYNAGPEAVAAHKGVPPFPETQSYVSRILKLYKPARS